MPRVREHLAGRGVEFEEISHSTAYTGIDEARAMGIEADDVAKTVVVRAGDGFVLLAVPASRRLAMRRVQSAVGDNHARLATEDEIEGAFPGFQLGALPPLGSLLDRPLYVDPELLRHDTIVFAAGTQTDSVRVRTADLFGGEPFSEAPLTRHPEGEDEDEDEAPDG